MIYVDRSAVRAPDVLTRPNGPGASETKRAKKHFGSDHAPEPGIDGEAATETRGKFRFNAYREPAVKQALEYLFHGKCAYCESRYQGTQPMDVEHWRPKGRIDEAGELEHGYYWLAADWDNLFPSCIDCNRRRNQIVHGRERPAGKGSRFPLAPGFRHARRPGDEIRERCLLLNPSRDKPEQHLEFTEESEGVVRARRDAAGKPSPEADASIEVYGLNRIGLVQDRREILRLILQRMFTIRHLLNLMAEGRFGSWEMSMAEDVLFHELLALHRFQRPERPFAQMARQVIGPFIAEITGDGVAA